MAQWSSNKSLHSAPISERWISPVEIRPGERPKERWLAHPKIIFRAVHEDLKFIRAAFDQGASCCVFKSFISADLTNAIDIIFNSGQSNSSVLHRRG